MDNLLLKFFLPALDEPVHAVLQLSFAAIFAAAMIATLWRVRRAACSERWEHNLARLDTKHETDATAWSADELASAVATPEERWADVVPSLLLVFGLLGTFIGLGLALTEAAQALGPGGDALDNLTKIMGSLGSKFKTSTWGILAFLTLKVYFVLRPYEEARLDWAAQKRNAWAAEAAARQRQRSEEDSQRLINAIAQMGGALVTEHQRATRQSEDYQARSLETLQQLIDGHADAARQQHRDAEHQFGALTQISDLLAAAAKQQDGLLARVDELGTQGVRQIEQLDEQQEHLAEMAEHSAASRVAMDGFVHSVSSNIAMMASAADNMAVAAKSAGEASTSLSEVVGEFREQMISVLNNVKQDLNGTIDRMSGTFGEHMQTMSADLAKATSGIGHAISTLSGGVQETVTTLHTASEESIKRQTLAQANFSAAGRELMTAIGTLEASFGEMGERISSGLASVSTTGQQLRHFETHFKTSNERVNVVLGNIETLASATQASTKGLQAVATLGAEVRDLITGIQEQGQWQANAVRGQQQQLDAFERTIRQVAALTEAMTGVVAAAQNTRDDAARERALAALERIEAGIAGIGHALERVPPTTEATAA
jgi:hypothetical protein